MATFQRKKIGSFFGPARLNCVHTGLDLREKTPFSKGVTTTIEIILVNYNYSQGRRRRYCHYCHGSTFCRDTKAVGTPIPSIKKRERRKNKENRKKEDRQRQRDKERVSEIQRQKKD